jgi:hypothetical protein
MKKNRSIGSIIVRIRNLNLKRLLTINGVIVTLLIGLTINYLSSVVEEKINTQKYLELLQLEMRTNYLVGENQISQFENTGMIVTELYLSDDVYKSGFNSGYIFKLDSNTASKIHAYYTYLPPRNRTLNEQHQIIVDATKEWMNCIATLELDAGIRANEYTSDCKFEEEKHKNVVEFHSITLYEQWKSMNDDVYQTVISYNPTEARLNSFWLKLFMGNDYLKSQSAKQF